jgi:putative DNA primase/helicase
MWMEDVAAVRAAINEGNSGAPTLGKSWKRGTGKHPPALELYTGGRWFAVTGNPWPGRYQPGIAILKRDTVLLTFMQHSAPNFVAGKSNAYLAARKSAPKPRKGRSEHAMAIGGRMKRNGASPEDIEAAIREDDIGGEWAGDHDQRQIDRVVERAGAGAELSDMTGFGLNEDGITGVFAKRFSGQLKFDHHRGCWYQWDGAHWRLEETRLAFDWVRATCRELRLKSAADPAARALAKASTAEAVERMAQRDRAFAVTSAVWDCDPWLLGTPTGTVDLRTGELRAARPEDMISRSTAVGPPPEFDAWFHIPRCPLWLKFLDEATGSDKEMIRFLQQWVGYSLTGITTERALLFIYGRGGNGKGTFYNLIAWLLGGYQQTAAIETFTAGSFDRHPTELAALHGARFVRSSETEQGRSWAQSRIKLLTGGDPVQAHFMHKNGFAYIPQFKLNFDGNHMPKLRNFGDAERDRFNIAHFDKRPAKPNPDLAEQLKSEGPEILAWGISGCLDWQCNELILLSHKAAVCSGTVDRSIRIWCL